MLIRFTDGSRPIPQWKKILDVSENKHSLSMPKPHSCLWRIITHTKRIPCLLGSGNEEVLKIAHNGIEKARDLFSSHEESDSKDIIFHAVSSDEVLRNQIEMGV